MSENIFFDTKSEDDNSIMTKENELPNNGLNLSESKFKPIITNLLPPNSGSGGKLLDIVDNSGSDVKNNPSQPWLVPPSMPLFPPGMAPPLPMISSIPPNQLGLASTQLPGPPPAPGTDIKPPIPPPFLPLPMMPPGPFPPTGLPLPPGMPPNFSNLPMPPAFFNPQLFPFPAFGRDLKKIGKRWGRSKRAKGKVDIDKATGRKLITAITCVACFKAKKKCIYADQNAKRCNYCLNRGINCVKRIDRRCQKIWHESGRRARLYAKAVVGDEDMDMLEMKEKSDDLELKNEELPNESQKTNEDKIGESSDNDLLLNLPDPEPLIRGRRFFRDSRNPLWTLIAENANPNVG